MQRPLVICCSQRFKDELDAFVEFLEKRSMLVYSPNFRYHRKDFIAKPEHLRLRSPGYKARVPGMVWSHFDHLREGANQSGVCLIFNPRPMNGQKKQFGYIGSNTQGEIGCAKGLGMPVLLMKPHEEEWVMTVAHQPADPKRVFSIMHPRSSPEDFDKVFTWLKRWLR